jgi:hypothetical protein
MLGSRPSIFCGLWPFFTMKSMVFAMKLDDFAIKSVVLKSVVFTMKLDDFAIKCFFTVKLVFFFAVFAR